MNYEELLLEADNAGLITKEKPLRASNGRIKGRRIAIRQSLTSTEKACVLAEELGHHFTTFGDILNQDDVRNRKQEFRARLWAYNKQVGLLGIIKSFEYGCHSLPEMAEYLEVDETFLQNALEQYRKKYGVYTTLNNYIIYFEPTLNAIRNL